MHLGLTIAQDDAARPGRPATPELPEWRWETIAGPVLTALGHTPLPRVWWVPAGPLGLLPLHAAGVRGGPSALDRVVSSHTPTVRALLHARRRPVAETRTQLADTMRRTPGMADLTGTAAEAFQLAGYRHVVATLWPVDDTVAAMAARRFCRLLGDSPTADGATHALHETTCRPRDRFPGAPGLWAPFVHSAP
ncbi:CHAT domain-containing protein [Streptomyces niveiscabiei]|uniref:CHAT domain-containing protein n=1 Tax=Streptomyces niveiscabiei TaxID=164115 RepID=UPI0029B2F2CC|nr:CHAT domain-containing protein [Streptomyces niveiscabiei]MDX3387465.1 CHAT domain-containing protein [Streptomyces niveiscabiei]